MAGIRKHGEEIRNFIINNVSDNTKFIAALTSKEFNISKPAVYKHLRRLINDGILTHDSLGYSLKSEWHVYKYKITEDISEDKAWEIDIKKHFVNFADNVKHVWLYVFSEIFNNAIEHSNGDTIVVIVKQNKFFTEIGIVDNGVGIFKNIKDKFKLLTEKEALLELTKGKRTTEKSRHSGQGIFFASKMVDRFLIYSDEIYFVVGEKDIFIKQGITEKISIKIETLVSMRMQNNSKTIPKKIFDKFGVGEFNKTIIPIKMAKDDDLVSRSQARRVLNGLELFREVILDFKDIKYIGQAFADEIFRVFPAMNPDTKIIESNTNADIQNMINRARNTKL
jgi:anti-sigma regulatory factor (Ser/Thr protein kinase)/predicted transcriptional regulator